MATPANIRDDFVGDAPSPAIGGRMSYADLLRSAQSNKLYTPPAAQNQALSQRLAGDVLPMPGVSPNRAPIVPSREQVFYGSNVAPYLKGTNVIRSPIRPDLNALTNIYTQNPPTK